jgi:hypothetical protein
MREYAFGVLDVPPIFHIVVDVPARYITRFPSLWTAKEYAA